MATDIVQGLFGMTPESYQQQRDAEAYKRAAAFGQMDPMQAARTSIFYGANQLGGAIGGMLGAEDPQMRLISQRNALARQFDVSTPEGLAQYGQALQQIGDTQGALGAIGIGRQMTQEMALTGQRKAAERASVATAEKTELSVEQEKKLRDELSRLPTNATEEQILGVVTKYGSPDKVLAALQSSADKAAQRETLLTLGREKIEAKVEADLRQAKNDIERERIRIEGRKDIAKLAASLKSPSAPVAVIDPVTNKQILVSREEALANRMTPVSGFEGLSPKEIQLRNAKYPQAKTAVLSFNTSAEKLATDLETLADSKGLDGITGLIGGRTPAITKEARAAEALYNSIVARGGFNELQNIRASSPTGGALGNVSNVEGQQLRDAFAPLKLTQNASDLKAALKKAAQETRAAAGRIKDTFDLTYEYKSQGDQGNVKLDPLGIR
jgi:hypothetical protein